MPRNAAIPAWVMPVAARASANSRGAISGSITNRCLIPRISRAPLRGNLPTGHAVLSSTTYSVKKQRLTRTGCPVQIPARTSSNGVKHMTQTAEGLVVTLRDSMDLYSAKLCSADLGSADLYSAKLCSADLSGAD